MKQEDLFVHIIRLVVLACIAFIFGYMLTSCKSVKTTTRINYQDSTVYVLHYDTTRIEVVDSTHTEKSDFSDYSEYSDIEFSQGGGRIVLDSLGRVIEANNVARIRQSKQLQQLQQENSTLKSENKELRHTNEQLQKSMTIMGVDDEQQQNTAEIKPKTSGWHRFLVWWFFITAGLLLGYGIYKGYRLYRKFTIGV